MTSWNLSKTRWSRQVCQFYPESPLSHFVVESLPSLTCSPPLNVFVDPDFGSGWMISFTLSWQSYLCPGSLEKPSRGLLVKKAWLARFRTNPWGWNINLFKSPRSESITGQSMPARTVMMGLRRFEKVSNLFFSRAGLSRRASLSSGRIRSVLDTVAPRA
jgi:hypothetical protein